MSRLADQKLAYESAMRGGSGAPEQRSGPHSLRTADANGQCSNRSCSRQSLFANLDRVANEFPAAVRQRGINRNWSEYRYVLAQLSRLLERQPQRPQDYLDLGAGAGVIPLVMAMAGLNVTAVDTWDEYAEEMDNLMGSFPQFASRFDRHRAHWAKHDITQTPLPFSTHSFDLISLFAVLEHLPRPRNVLQEVGRLLRPGGILLVTLPNVANLRNRLRLALGRSPHADSITTWFQPVFSGHYREMTMREVREALTSFGFSVLAAEYTNACHWNTRFPDGRWGQRFRPNSMHQLAKLLYLCVTQPVPGFRYELLVAARKE